MFSLDSLAWFWIGLDGIDEFCMDIICLIWYKMVLAGIEWFCIVFGGIGWFLIHLNLNGFEWSEWLWMVLSQFKRCWMALDGFGWHWLVLADIG